MKNIFKYFLAFFLLLSCSSYAQELNCTVKVSAQKIQVTDPKVFQTMQKALSDFMNNRKWTTDIFGIQEKIECSYLVTVTGELGGTRYSATLSVTSNRPVFNSNYNSTMLNIVDADFDFDYAEYTPIDFTDNSSSNTNLANVFAFYAYIIIGLDYDSFSPKGGAPWYAKAMNIVTLNQNSSEVGWKSFEKVKNRYWLAENLTDDKYDLIHTALYSYHREGLDKMYEDPEVGRTAITGALTDLDKMNTDNPGSMIIQQFFAAKGDELSNVYTKATADEKTNAYALLVRMDPTNTSRYQKFTK